MTLLEMIQRIQDLERRVANMIRHAPAQEVDPAKQTVRLSLAPEGDPEMLSPPIPYAQVAGPTESGLKIHAPPMERQNMTVFAPSGDLRQAVAVPMTWSNDAPSPGQTRDPVLTYGHPRPPRGHRRRALPRRRRGPARGAVGGGLSFRGRGWPRPDRPAPQDRPRPGLRHAGLPPRGPRPRRPRRPDAEPRTPRGVEPADRRARRRNAFGDGLTMGALGTKLRTAQGGRLAFYCPGCEHAHVVRTGTGPGPRWTFNGDPELPTLSPSVRVFHPAHVDEDDGPKPEETLCHLFLREGRLQFLGDCAHALAGKTVDLPDWPADYGFGGDP